MKLKKVRLIRIETIESKALLASKDNKTIGEYCWTLKPLFIKYVLDKKKVDSVLYLDSDIYLFGDVAKLFKFAGKNSLGLSPHNFPGGMEGREKRGGKFNAGMVFVRNDKEGRKAINRWSKQCIDWCYYRLEDGKMADQMYLDEWPNRYNKVFLYDHKGVNLAPWNAESFQIEKKNGRIFVDGKELISFHFHGIKIDFEFNYIESFGYILKEDLKKYIYTPYIPEVKKIFREIRKVDPEFDSGLKNISWLYKTKSRLLGAFLPTYWRFI